MKALLFIPFLALLGTSCGEGHITTTPVVNAPQAQAFTPTRKNLANAIDPATNSYTFNVSIQDDGTSTYYYDFKTGTTAETFQSLKNLVGNFVGAYVRTWFGSRNLTFFASTDYMNSTLDLPPASQPQKDLNLYLKNLNYQGITPPSSGGSFTINQSVINISGKAIINPYFQEGYDQGSLSGYENGMQQGHEQGYQEGYDEGHEMGYETGYNDGRADEHQTAFEEGYNEGIIEGQIEAGNNNAVNLYGLYASLYWLPSHTTATAFFKQYEGFDLFPQVHLTFDPVNIDGLGSTNTPYSNAKQVRLGFVQNFDNLNNLNITWYKNDRVYTIGNFNRSQIADGYFTTESRIKTWDTQTFEFKYNSTDINDYHDFTIRPYQQVFNLGGMFNTMMKLSRIEIGNLWDTEGTPLPQSLYDKYTQDLMRSLIGGTGYSYAQGFQDGTNKAVSSQNAYKNIFTIFTPAFSAVAHFFDMSIGPFKMWYFFVIPLMITALVLFIKLVKH